MAGGYPAGHLCIGLEQPAETKETFSHEFGKEAETGMP
jgi:hypothetical protein